MDLSQDANDNFAKPIGKGPIKVDGVPFRLPQGQRDALSLRRAEWINWQHDFPWSHETPCPGGPHDPRMPVLHVPVADYVAKVDEPKDEELKTFFDEHKEEHPQPASPEPGFREPQRVALQWFKADQDKFLAQVTDAEIKQRYEKNKELYDAAEKKPEADAK